MPFIIPLVVALAVEATALVVALAAASAVVGAIGYATGNEDLMKVSAVLGIASGVASGLEGAASAAGSEAMAVEGAVAAEGAVDAGALVDVPPGAEMDIPLDTEVIGGTAPGAAAESGIIGSEMAAPTGAEDTLAGQTSTGQTAAEIPDATNMVPGTDQANQLAPPDPADPAQDMVSKAIETQKTATTEAGAEYDMLKTAWGGENAPTDFLDTLKAGWKSLDGRAKAQILQIGGDALKGAFGDNPQMEQAKTKRLQYELELEKYRTRMKNMNNIGQITLGMNPQPK